VFGGVLFITRVHDGDAYVCFHTCGELQIETFAISSNIYGFSIRVQFQIFLNYSVLVGFKLSTKGKFQNKFQW